MSPSFNTATNLFFKFIILSSLGCASSKSNRTAEYAIYYNDPKMAHAVQPWPLETKAQKVFQAKSANLNALFASEVANSKRSEDNLYYDSDSKLVGKMRIEREELVIAITDIDTKSTIYLDRKRIAWRNGFKVLIQSEVLDKVFDELEEMQKSILVKP